MRPATKQAGPAPTHFALIRPRFVAETGDGSGRVP